MPSGRTRTFVSSRLHCAEIVVAVLVAVGVITATLLTAAFGAPNFPELTGRIVDEAGLLSFEDRTAIETELVTLENASSDQLVVVTLNSLQGYSIDDYGTRLGRHWKIGQEGTDNGILLIVAPNERKVRIEVGYGLEPLMTDLMSGLIIRNAILPSFKRGNFGEGIRAGVRDIKAVLLGDAEAVKERLSRRKEPGIGTEELIILAIWLAIFLMIIYAQYQQAKALEAEIGPDGKRRKRRRRARDGGIIIIPGGSSDWSGGSGGGWSGGGWSGGGGSFGGGGASGGW